MPLDGDGNRLFDTSVPDINLPQIISQSDNDIRYIVFTAEDGNGNAVSYVSAECNGSMRNIKVTYRRQLATDFPHPSYLHAIYAANNNSQLYKFLLEKYSVSYNL